MDKELARFIGWAAVVWGGLFFLLFSIIDIFTGEHGAYVDAQLSGIVGLLGIVILVLTDTNDKENR